MTKKQLLEWLIARFLRFKDWWTEHLKYAADDNGGFTYHGLCQEFGNFFQEHYLGSNEQSLAELFEHIEFQLRNDPEDESDHANAWATCFLENIASTPSGSFAKKHMKPESKLFFQNWHSEHMAQNPNY